jgi:hypothetical protein
MKSKWTSVEGAVNQVIALLEQAGAPLELQVADICKDFGRIHAVLPISK